MDGHSPLHCPAGRAAIWRVAANKASFYDARNASIEWTPPHPEQHQAGYQPDVNPISTRWGQMAEGFRVFMYGLPPLAPLCTPQQGHSHTASQSGVEGDRLRLLTATNDPAG